MDVFELYAKLSLDSKEYDEGLDNAGQKASVFTDVLKANLVTKGIGVAVQGLQKLGQVAVQTFQTAISGYADYEQLVGGVETLFKRSSDKVVQYAQRAYKTAGISANDYMETVTSFSASLLQSLEGDTERAAEIADQAIIDMADNANKMGTAMSSIQTAYQGFAKGQYQLLDNLKLGYGGTKEEMERLLKHAEEVKRSQGEMAEYSIESYADIIEAIHVVQEEMGITGTTAKEGSATVSGSIAMMKSAWHNLVNGLANDNADIDKLMDDLVDAVEIAFDNLMPVAERALEGLIEMAFKFVPKFGELGVKIAGALLKGILTSPLKAILDLFGIRESLENRSSGVKNEFAEWYSQTYRANGGFMEAGKPYITSEFKRELIVPAEDSYAFSGTETEGILGRSLVININGDVYDDESSMKRKLYNAVTDIIGTELSYG